MVAPFVPALTVAQGGVPADGNGPGRGRDVPGRRRSEAARGGRRRDVPGRDCCGAVQGRGLPRTLSLVFAQTVRAMCCAWATLPGADGAAGTDTQLWSARYARPAARTVLAAQRRSPGVLRAARAPQPAMYRPARHNAALGARRGQAVRRTGWCVRVREDGFMGISVMIRNRSDRGRVTAPDCAGGGGPGPTPPPGPGAGSEPGRRGPAPGGCAVPGPRCTQG